MAEDAGIEGRTNAEFALTVRAANSDATATVPLSFSKSTVTYLFITVAKSVSAWISTNVLCRHRYLPGSRPGPNSRRYSDIVS